MSPAQDRLGNRANSQKSTWPRQHETVRLNALKHGILTHNLTFKGDEETNQFEELVAGLVDEYQPAGLSERALVEDAAIALWQLGKLYGWGEGELENRRKATQHVLEQLAENEHCEEAPLFGGGYGMPSSTRQGWDCQEVIVRTGSTTSGPEGFNESRRKTATGSLRQSCKLLWNRSLATKQPGSGSSTVPSARCARSSENGGRLTSSRWEQFQGRGERR